MRTKQADIVIETTAAALKQLKENCLAALAEVKGELSDEQLRLVERVEANEKFYGGVEARIEGIRSAIDALRAESKSDFSSTLEHTVKSWEANLKLIEERVQRAQADNDAEIGKVAATLEVKIDKKLADFETLLDIAEQTKASLNEQAESFELKAIETDDRFAEVDKQLVDANKRLSDADERLADIDERFEKIAGSEGELRGDFDELEKMFEGNVEAVDNQISHTSDRITQTNDTLFEVRDKLLETDARVTEFADVGAALKADIASLEAQIREVDQDGDARLDVVRSELGALRSYVSKNFDELVANVGDWDANIESLREQTTVFAQALDEVRKDSGNRIMGLDQAVSVLRSNLKDLSDTSDTKHETTEEKLLDLESKIRTTDEAVGERLDSLSQGLVRVANGLDNGDDEIKSDLGLLREALDDAIADTKKAQEELRDDVLKIAESKLGTHALVSVVEELEKKIDGVKDIDVEAAVRGVLPDYVEAFRGPRGEDGLMKAVQSYTPGRRYQATTILRVNGGLCQASVDTDQEPGGDDWRWITEGLKDIRVTNTEIGRFTLEIETTTETFEAILEVPVPKFHRTYESDREYKFMDSVIDNGHRWVSAVDNPKGPPRTSPDWFLYGMQGPRGPKGKPGDMGPPGKDAPTLREIEDAFITRLNSADGTPILVYRDLWEYGSSYNRGDLCKYAGDLYLLSGTRGNGGTEVPASPASDWIIFFQTPRSLAYSSDSSPPTDPDPDPDPGPGPDPDTDISGSEFTHLLAKDDSEPQNTVGAIIGYKSDHDAAPGSVFFFPSLPGVGNEEPPYTDGDGGVSVEPAEVRLLGTETTIESLSNSLFQDRIVYATEQGILYGVLPPDPGWSVTDTDTGIYDLGTGSGQGPLSELALSVTIPETVAPNVRLDFFAMIWGYEVGGRSGIVDLGFGINGAEPLTYISQPIGANFSGGLPVTLAMTVHGGFAQDDTISVWMRRASGDHSQFGVIIDGTMSLPHELTVSLPIGAQLQAENAELETKVVALEATVANLVSRIEAIENNGE